MNHKLTQKELMYLNDYLGAEEKEMKKFHHAANLVSDIQAKTLLNNIATLHQSHFDTLKKHVDMSNIQ